MPKDNLVLNARISLLRKLLEALKLLLALKLKQGKVESRLYRVAVSWIGKDASPADEAPDELGCAESVSKIISKVIPFPTILGTWTLWQRLRNDYRFQQVYGGFRAGDIIVSPTGTGNRSAIGHTGIFGQNQAIMSNSSGSGKWTQNYDLNTWNDRYYLKLGILPHYFRIKSGN